MKKVILPVVFFGIIAAIYFGYIFVSKNSGKVAPPEGIPPVKPSETPQTIKTPEHSPQPQGAQPSPSPQMAASPSPQAIKPSAPTVSVIPYPDGKKSRFISKLTGEAEKTYNPASGTCSQNPTLSKTESNFGLKGTDLGNSFADGAGRIWYLFGDTIKSANNKKNYGGPCPNSIAYQKAIDAQGRVTLEFTKDANNNFLPMTVPGEKIDCFDVPSDGVYANGAYYIWLHEDNGLPEPYLENFYRSYLVKTADMSNMMFTKLFDLSFQDDCLVTKSEGAPPIPVPNCTKKYGKFVTTITADAFGGDLYVFGGGEYRKTDLYLYKTPLAQIENKSAIRYFAGTDTMGNPIWSQNETDAVPAVDTPSFSEKGTSGAGNVGESSVAYVKELGLWIVMYQGTGGVRMHTAKNPWGPWSEPQIVLDPNKEAYCVFMYTPGKPCQCMDESGKPAGPYAPAIVNENTVPDGQGGAYVKYVLSTWNPYNTVMLEVHLKRE